jgi:hypothetical protein
MRKHLFTETSGQVLCPLDTVVNLNSAPPRISSYYYYKYNAVLQIVFIHEKTFTMIFILSFTMIFILITSNVTT